MKDKNKLRELLITHLEKYNHEETGFFVTCAEAKYILSQLTKTCEYKHARRSRFKKNYTTSCGNKKASGLSPNNYTEYHGNYCGWCGGKIEVTK